jgi:hypothetical protein
MRPRAKHMNLKYHHFREAVSAGKVTIHAIDTKDQLANIFTKPLWLLICLPSFALALWDGDLSAFATSLAGVRHYSKYRRRNERENNTKINETQQSESIIIANMRRTQHQRKNQRQRKQ